MSKKQSNSSKSIEGYFAATQDENFKKGMVLTAGRSGIYEKKEELITIINVCPCKKGEIKIIKVIVPQEAIIHKSEKPLRFKIKGRMVKVTEVESFKDALKVMVVPIEEAEEVI